MCRDKDNYHSVSVRNYAFSKLGVLTDIVVPGVSLSKAKVVEKLINDSFSSLNNPEVTNEKEQRQEI